MWVPLLIAVYCVFIVGASLAGGWMPSMMRLTQRGMQLLMCLVAGLMLGVAILHLMPHSFAETGSIDTTALWIIAGLLVMWALVRLFHFHQHVTVDEEGHIEAVDCEHEHGHAHHHEHEHGSHEAKDDSREPTARDDSSNKYNWIGVAFGLGLHTLIDGVALGAAVVSEAAHGHEFPIYGLGVFIAVALHKPMDALAVTALMHSSGWSWKAQTLVNLAFAAMCPVGAFAFVFGAGVFEQQSFLIGCALAFSCGVFLWISLGDLLPDVHFHSVDRSKFAAALLIGVLVAWGIGFLEPDHVHGGGDGHSHGHSHAESEHQHDDHGHSHDDSDHGHAH